MKSNACCCCFVDDDVVDVVVVRLHHIMMGNDLKVNKPSVSVALKLRVRVCRDIDLDLQTIRVIGYLLPSRSSCIHVTLELALGETITNFQGKFTMFTVFVVVKSVCRFVKLDLERVTGRINW